MPRTFSSTKTICDNIWTLSHLSWPIFTSSIINTTVVQLSEIYCLLRKGWKATSGVFAERKRITNNLVPTVLRLKFEKGRPPTKYQVAGHLHKWLINGQTSKSLTPRLQNKLTVEAYPLFPMEDLTELFLIQNSHRRWFLFWKQLWSKLPFFQSRCFRNIIDEGTNAEALWNKSILTNHFIVYTNSGHYQIEWCGLEWKSNCLIIFYPLLRRFHLLCVPMFSS